MAYYYYACVDTSSLWFYETVPNTRKKVIVPFNHQSSSCFLSQHDKNLARLAQFCLMDDTFMRQVFKNAPEAINLILRIIMQRSDITVTEVETQVEYPSILEHSVVLDVRAIDDNGITYNIEVQNHTSSDDLRKRSRYHSSMLDTKLLKKGASYNELPETYVIFICKNDIFEEGLPIYHIERYIEELDYAPFMDGSHILFVNGQYQNLHDPLGQLIHDLHCKNAEDMLFPVLANRVRYFKEEKGGITHMCKIMEEAIAEAKAEVAAARQIERIEQVQRMLSRNEPLDNIVYYTGFTLEEIENIRSGKIHI